jgi:hypothetical protein
MVMMPARVSKIVVNSLAFLMLMAVRCSAAQAEDPVLATPCELLADPPTYDGKLVTVRSAITVGFENSGFDVKCQNTEWGSIWVTFAGDVEMPVVFCCGDHSRKPETTLTVNDMKLSLNKDAEFQKYSRLLTAVRKQSPTGVPCFYDCFQYKVTATLTGHFFAGEKWQRPDDGKIFYMGYGHLGCCSLFVIEKVDEVTSQPTGIPIGDDFNCSHQKWQLPVDHDAVVIRQTHVKAQAVNDPGIDTVGEELVKERMKSLGDDFDGGDVWYGSEGKFQKETEARYMWLSTDKLESYTVNFQRFDWLGAFAKKIDDRVWTPVTIERAVCEAKR